MVACLRPLGGKYMENAEEFLERAGALLLFCIALGILFLEAAGLDKLLTVRTIGRFFRVLINIGGVM